MNPAEARAMLFARNDDGSLRPFFRGRPEIGNDTEIPGKDTETIAVLYVALPGYFPQAWEFDFSKIADFFPILRKRPESGEGVPRGEIEELGELIRREVDAGRVRDP